MGCWRLSDKRFKLSELIEHLPIEMVGDDVTVDGLSTLGEASQTKLSFFVYTKYIEDLKQTKAAAVLLKKEDLEALPKGATALICQDPYLMLAHISKKFAYTPNVQTYKPQLGEGCQVAPDASFGKNVVLGDRVVVMSGVYVGEGVSIGDDTILYPNVTIYQHCKVGKRCIIHSGAVIGADGYGFARDESGNHVKIYQLGNVVVEDDVEIGANTTVDRATFTSTIIGEGTKLDNLIQVAHNCILGKRCLMAGQSGLAGSTILEDNVTFAGQSGATGHLKVGKGAVVAAKSAVTKSVEGGKMYAGYPAIEIGLWKKLQVLLMRMVKKRS